MDSTATQQVSDPIQKYIYIPSSLPSWKNTQNLGFKWNNKLDVVVLFLVMEPKDDQEDGQEDDAGGDEDEPHGRSRVDEDADLPVWTSAGGSEDHQLGIRDDWRPGVGEVGGPGNR